MFKLFLIGVSLSFLFGSCSIFNYEYKNPNQDITVINAPVAKDSIESYLTNLFGSSYIPYSFSPLAVNKPTEIIELDSLYLQRKNAKQKNNDSLFVYYNNLIDEKKKEIKAKKVYHTFEMSHIFLLTPPNDSIRLYENNFVLFPNKKIKDVHSVFSTSLSKEEKDYFDYFYQQKPLYVTADPYYDDRMNANVYDNFNNALESISNDKKGELLHSILISVKSIKETNSFNPQLIAEGVAIRWLKQHAKNTLRIKFSALSKIKQNEEIVGYTLHALDKKTNTNYTFTYDANFIILNVEMK